MKIAAMIFFSIGAVFVLTAVFIFRGRNNKRKRCTYKTQAVIAGVDHFNRTSSHRAHNYGVYEYEYNGRIYRKRSYVGTSWSPEMGRIRDAFVNPEIPEECIIEGWVSALAGGLFLGFGILFIVMSVIFVII